MDDYSRNHETEAERLDRNWNELLQELRVTQTGVQILTGFLLAMPFQQRFSELTRFGVGVYIAAVVLTLISTCLLITPVSMHRLLFRQRRKETLVDLGDHLAEGGLAVLGLAISAVATLIFTMVFSERAGLMAGGATLVLYAAAWLVLPLSMRAVSESPSSEHPR
jgi:Family of unknown function (DUF6328)